MNTLTKDQLADHLADYGYPLLHPSFHKPEDVLESLLEQDEFRFLEGFPVVLANVLKDKEPFDWERPRWRPDHFSKKARRRLPYLLALSYFLFKTYLEKSYPSSRLLKLLFQLPRGAKAFKQVEKSFTKSEPVKAGDEEFSTERLKNTFQTYMTQMSTPQKDEKLEQKKHALELELLLSEVFTPRQKTLLRKKREGKPFTKTEKEYFSRVVKKRLKALASDELHHLARELVLK